MLKTLGVSVLDLVAPVGVQLFYDGAVPTSRPRAPRRARRRRRLPRPRAAGPRARPARRARRRLLRRRHGRRSSLLSSFARLARLRLRLRLRRLLPLGLLRLRRGAAVLSTPPSDDLTASPTEAAIAATAPPALSTRPFIVDWTPSTTSSGGPSSSFIIAAMSPTVTRPPPRAKAALRTSCCCRSPWTVGGGGLGCAWPLRRGSWLRVAALRVFGCEYAAARSFLEQ